VQTPQGTSLTYVIPKDPHLRDLHGLGVVVKWLIAGLPNDLSRLLRAARRGGLEIRIDIPHLKRLGNQLDRTVNRLVVGIAAALIIGSSIVMTVPGGPTLLGQPLFGLLGFLGAVIAGGWLLTSIWRTRREE